MIRKLEWDSNFFGLNIAEIDPAKVVSDTIDIDDFIAKNNINLVQTCCNINDINKIHLFEGHGFHFIDLKVTYTLDIKKTNFLLCDYSLASENDVKILKQIAKVAFTDSRYYSILNLNKKKIDNLYEVWLEKSVNGKFDDYCLKVCNNMDPIGFATLKLFDKKARIGLIGINPLFQGKSFGYRLLMAVYNFLVNKEVNSLEVITQGKNVVAQNFYIKHGFKIKEIESWYYKLYEGR